MIGLSCVHFDLICVLNHVWLKYDVVYSFLLSVKGSGHASSVSSESSLNLILPSLRNCD